MRLSKARVTNYRSVIDSGWFALEARKTILVGPNEAGKTAILQALQHINPPSNIAKLDALRDYPRSKYNEISTKQVIPKDVNVVEAEFTLDDEDRAAIPPSMRECVYVRGRRLDNTAWHMLRGGPTMPTYESISKELTRLCAHIDVRSKAANSDGELPSKLLAEVTSGWQPRQYLTEDMAKPLKTWLANALPLIDENDKSQDDRYDRLVGIVSLPMEREEALKALDEIVPLFVLFSNYFRVRPLIQLDHLAQRLDSKILDDDFYDYGNVCLLKLLGFTARELSTLGATAAPAANDPTALQRYRDSLDKRSYQLNSASVRLTAEIRNIWRPQEGRAEADKLRVQADGQYLKVVVEDDLGVEIELHQRSEGFQWLVSFFVVFFAEAEAKHKNAVLLLDEPGMSLHGLKQREFRSTLSRLSETNQTIYSTHSPFLVGPDELDLVRVIEMRDRSSGTKANSVVASGDPAAILPLQEALGYDLAQSLFANERNLVLEGLTDYWYLEVTSELLRVAEIANLNEKISLVPAASAGKVVYYATILYAHNLKVAALLDSDSAGDQAAQQDNLVHTLGNKAILRTKDAYSGSVAKPEIEDLLRDTLISIAKTSLGIDVSADSAAHPSRSVCDLLSTSHLFSKYKLAKAYLKWARERTAADLTEAERAHFKILIEKINKALK